MAEEIATEESLVGELGEFRRGFLSVVMATTGVDGAPTASYAPYVTGTDGDCYILVSGLARHTRDLLESGRASLLFVENEAEAQSIFGRRRLTVQCLASEVPRDASEWDEQLDRLRERQGKLVEMLRRLPDFRLFRLAPEAGAWVGGFARAQPLGAAAARAVMRDDS